MTIRGIQFGVARLIDERDSCPCAITPRSSARLGSERGFTLLELLVVFVIIGILASITLPALKGIGQANLTAAGNRQLLDDLFMARQRAINERTTVYMVFVPPTIYRKIDLERNLLDLGTLTNLIGSQYTGYALLAARTVGDQPGRFTPRYLTGWKTLPDGMLFAPYKYNPRFQAHPNEYIRTFSTNAVPFPNSGSFLFELPFIGFNAQGQLISQRDELIPIAKGRVSLPQNDLGEYLRAEPDIQLIPPVTPGAPPYTQTNTFQFVRISWITGRAEMDPFTTSSIR